MPCVGCAQRRMMMTESYRSVRAGDFRSAWDKVRETNRSIVMDARLARRTAAETLSRMNPLDRRNINGSNSRS